MYNYFLFLKPLFNIDIRVNTIIEILILILTQFQY